MAAGTRSTLHQLIDWPIRKMETPRGRGAVMYTWAGDGAQYGKYEKHGKAGKYGKTGKCGEDGEA